MPELNGGDSHGKALAEEGEMGRLWAKISLSCGELGFYLALICPLNTFIQQIFPKYLLCTRSFLLCVHIFMF